MLQLKVKDIDISRLSKILVKYSIKASISQDSIIIDGNIPDELIDQMCKDIDILGIHNFETACAQNTEVTYYSVKQGEVYWCDLVIPFGCEIGGRRPVIVVSNNSIATNPKCTIVTVVPCTTSLYEHPTQLNFEVSHETMVNYPKNWTNKPSSALTNQIRSVEKARFAKYIGQMTPDFMAKLQNVLKYSFNLN